jgi:hypothetical protein
MESSSSVVRSNIIVLGYGRIIPPYGETMTSGTIPVGGKIAEIYKETIS